MVMLLYVRKPHSVRTLLHDEGIPLGLIVEGGKHDFWCSRAATIHSKALDRVVMRVR